jgi:hypothetical protein
VSDFGFGPAERDFLTSFVNFAELAGVYPARRGLGCGFRIVNMSKTEFKELPEENISNLEKDYGRLKRFYLSL